MNLLQASKNGKLKQLLKFALGERNYRKTKLCIGNVKVLATNVEEKIIGATYFTVPKCSSLGCLGGLNPTFYANDIV